MPNAFQFWHLKLDVDSWHFPLKVVIRCSIFSDEFFGGTVGIKPGAFVSGSKYANNCAILLP